jgi:hypothetical protein
MPLTDPITELDARYSQPGVSATPWPRARQLLETANLYWITTVRPDGRPHVTPLLAVFLEDVLYFCTGHDERKGRNLQDNIHCVLTTGTNALDSGLDVVIEGDAVRVREKARLHVAAAAYELKYGAEWHFDVRDEAFWGAGDGEALVFAVAPITAFGFGKGEFSQTRWRFPSSDTASRDTASRDTASSDTA